MYNIGGRSVAFQALPSYRAPRRGFSRESHHGTLQDHTDIVYAITRKIISAGRRPVDEMAAGHQPPLPGDGFP
ncbi:MAG: hypothetical protein JWO80_6241 [Bryobacterales bacterium]|nr:hypothetical protein [Bryobacterales bacterium]